MTCLQKKLVYNTQGYRRTHHAIPTSCPFWAATTTTASHFFRVFWAESALLQQLRGKKCGAGQPARIVVPKPSCSQGHAGVSTIDYYMAVES